MTQIHPGKKAAGEKAAGFIRSGMTVGLGTGSTAYWAIERIGALVKEGLEIRAVATSLESERQAGSLGIPLIPFAEVDYIDVDIDGADEIDEGLNLIKGGGGALLREKIVAAASRKMIVVADESKLVSRLGQFPLPVEIVRFAWELTLRKIRALGPEAGVRVRDGESFVTDNGNYIVDCHFGSIQDPADLHDRLKRIPGVVETGLFLGVASAAVIGYADGATREIGS